VIIPGVLASSQVGVIPPPPVAGYRLWLDGKDNGVFSYSSGNLVSAWNDKSGNNYHFTQSTVANQPTRDSSTGKVTYDGTNDDLIAGTKFMDDIHNGSANTLFMVFNTTENGGALFATATGSAQVGFTFYNVSASNLILGCQRGSAGTSSVDSRNNTRPTNGTIGLSIINIDADAATADKTIYYLNTGSAQQTNTATFSPSTATSSHLPHLGNDESSSDGWAGELCEVIWYGGILSTTDRNLVRDYLITKWGI
jgi:hypothetical protein